MNKWINGVKSTYLKSEILQFLDFLKQSAYIFHDFNS